MSLFERIAVELVDAQKSRDQLRVSTLRFMISNLKNARIAKGADLTDEEVVGEIAKDAKRHKESIAAYEKAGRRDLADKEKAELVILDHYLPEQLGEEEVVKVVEASISETGATAMSDMGRVMAKVMLELKGKTDGETVSRIVKQRLLKD